MHLLILLEARVFELKQIIHLYDESKVLSISQKVKKNILAALQKCPTYVQKCPLSETSSVCIHTVYDNVVSAWCLPFTTML